MTYVLTNSKKQTKEETLEDIKGKKPGGVELLGQKHQDMNNPFGHPVIGWKKTSQGEGLFNPRGFATLRVAVMGLDKNGDLVPLYDQPMLVENAGSIVIATLGDDRIGLVRNFRQIGPRFLPEAGAGYVKALDEEKKWEELMNTLGRWSWEAPRGLAPDTCQKGESLEAFIVRTAKLEALEEAGFRVEDVQIVGEINTNPTFFAHSQYVVRARISSITDASPENLEIIGDKRFFTIKELRELNKAGEFHDGLTLAALALCGLL